LEQTGPYLLVLRVRGSRPASGIWALDTEPAFYDRFWVAYSGPSGESSGHRSHSFPVGFLTLGGSRGGWCVAGLDHSKALAIDRREPAAGSGCVVDRRRQNPEPHPAEFLPAALGDRNAGEVGDGLDRFVEGVLTAAWTKRRCRS
jgi:hypothetical protein